MTVGYGRRRLVVVTEAAFDEQFCAQLPSGISSTAAPPPLACGRLWEVEDQTDASSRFCGSLKRDPIVYMTGPVCDMTRDNEIEV
jgi:hypothetical protein